MLDSIMARLTILTCMAGSLAVMAWLLSSMVPMNPEGLGRLAPPLNPKPRRPTGKTRKLT